MARLHGKIAIITASTDGIGFAIAKRLAEEGAKVIVSSRNQNNVDQAVSKLKKLGFDVTGVVCHVSNANQRKILFETAEKLGGLDILVSNAAVNPAKGGVLDCDESRWEKLFDVNVKASFLMAKEALPLLRQRPSGRIIFISSMAGYLLPHFVGAYAASKTALFGLTKAAANQLAKDNITVNCIAPGLIKTNFAKRLLQDEEIVKYNMDRIPMKRFGVPEDISGTAAFLASEDSSYITGETIAVAGGMLSRL